MVQQFDREGAIKGAIEMGATTQQINDSLTRLNQPALSRYEQTLINENRYGQNFTQRLGQDLLDFGRGLGSFGGAVQQYATNPEFRQGINQAIAGYGQNVLRNKVNPIVDFANTFLEPYGTSLNQVVTNPIEATKTAAVNAATKPLNPIIDSMMFLPTGAVANTVAKLPLANSAGIRGVRTALLPTNKERAINDLINLGEVKYAKQSNTTQSTIRDLSESKDLEQAVRNLTLGVREGAEETTEKLKNFAKSMNDEMVKLGVDPNDAKRVAVNQRIYELINPNREERIPLQFVDDAVKNPTRQNIERLGIEPESFENILSEANKLYDEGLIYPITQRGLNFNQEDLRSMVDLGSIMSGVREERYLGNAPIADVAKNVPEGYARLYQDILNAHIAQDTVSELAEKFGRGISPDEIAKIGKGDVIISPTEFKQGVRTLFQASKANELGEAAKTFTKGLSNQDIKKYSNDLYVLDKNDLEAFKNRFAGLETDKLTGKFVQAFEPIIGAFKSTVLSDAPYFFGNRTGNAILNAISGADYAGVWNQAFRRQAKQYIPDYLKTSTSYFGLAPNLFDAGPAETFKYVTRNLRQAGKDFIVKDATPVERMNALGRILSGTQEYVTRPLFQAESTFELIDRYANYLNEAKKQANRMGKTTEEVLQLAKTDDNIQRQLVQNVNKNLGDYVGRNWFINPTDKRAAQMLFPFYRIANTSRDVLRNQLREHPFRMQAVTDVPMQLGLDLYNADTQANNQPSDNDMRGGLTTVPSYSSMYPRQVVFNNNNPLLTPLEVAHSVLGPSREGEGFVDRIADTLAGNMSPLTGLFNVLSGKDSYGNPSMGANSYKSGGTIVTLDENGNKIEQPDRLGAVVNYLRGNFLPVANLYNTTIGPNLGAITGQGFYSPVNRALFGTVGGQTKIPYLFEGRNIVAPNTTLYPEYLLGQMGFKTREVYPPYQQRLNENLLRRILQRRGREMIMQQEREGR